MHQARHKFLRKVDIPHINGIRKEWSNLLIAKSGYAATYSCNQEREPAVLLGEMDERIYIWLDGINTTLHGRDSVCLTMKTHAFAPYGTKPFVDEFIRFAKEHGELRFLVTRIGCGIAGFRDEEIAPLFKDAIDVENINLPKEFVACLVH